MAKTLEKLLQEGRKCLEDAGVPDVGLDAWYLLSEAFGIDRTHYFLERTREMSDERLGLGYERYQEMLKQRAKRIPLQQILGVQEFMALPFQVDRSVLIPRQDTETLAELVLKECKNRESHVLDVCTGSGCIALSLAVLGSYESVTALDISQDALHVAEKNVEALYLDSQIREKAGMSLEKWEKIELSEKRLAKKWETWMQNQQKTEFFLLESDLFDALPLEKKYDILVSNPPYIPSSVIEELEPEVRDHEPRLALDGKEDGLYFYRNILANAGAYLNLGAALYFEIGYDQGEALLGLFEEYGFEEARIIQDLTGNDRVAAARWNHAVYQDRMVKAAEEIEIKPEKCCSSVKKTDGEVQKCGGDGPH